MRRRLLLLIPLMMAGSTIASAQPPSEQAVALHPAAEPDPALRYVFWPTPEARIEGNAAPFVSRAVVLLLEKAPAPEQRQDYADKYSLWREMPIAELPVAEVKEYLDRYATAALAELDRAEPLMQIQYDLRLRDLSVTEMVATLLPEIQRMRELGRMLELRARLAVAEKRWDDFARDIRTGLRLSEVAGHSNDLLISRLVGFAISATMMAVVEDAIQQPECPNFYWALASIPDRLFDIRGAIEFESILLTKLVSRASPLPDAPVGPVRARELIREIADQASPLGFAPSSATARDLALGLAVVSLAEPSRELLEETPVWAGRSQQLSASEAVLRATILKLHRSRHQWLKWTMLPDELWNQYGERAETSLKTPADAPDIFVVLANQLVPAVRAAVTAARRTAQRRNLLITMESLRMHASRSNELPESIQRLEPVPAWKDPLANGEFIYHRLTPTSATLQGAPHSGDDKPIFKLSLKPSTPPSATESSQ